MENNSNEYSHPDRPILLTAAAIAGGVAVRAFVFGGLLVGGIGLIEGTRAWRKRKAQKATSKATSRSPRVSNPVAFGQVWRSRHDRALVVITKVEADWFEATGKGFKTSGDLGSLFDHFEFVSSECSTEQLEVMCGRDPVSA